MSAASQSLQDIYVFHQNVKLEDLASHLCAELSKAQDGDTPVPTPEKFGAILAEHKTWIDKNRPQEARWHSLITACETLMEFCNDHKDYQPVPPVFKSLITACGKSIKVRFAIMLLCIVLHLSLNFAAEVFMGYYVG